MRVHVFNGGVLIPADECRPGTPTVEICDNEWCEYQDHLEQAAEWEQFISLLAQEQAL